MSEKESKDKQGDVGPSLVLGLIGAVFVLILLAGAVWGVGKIISKVRESNEENKETVAEEQADGENTEEEQAEGETDEGSTEDTENSDEENSDENAEEGDINGDGASEDSETSDESADTQSDGEDQSGETTGGGVIGRWVANNYKYGDIEGSSYTVVRGDTLWEIAEARYGSGFEWHKIQEANFDAIRYLPNGSKALIVPGQVLTLP